MTNETDTDQTTKRDFTVDCLLGVPRLSSLALSPDGERLVASVAREADGGKRLSTALYEIDPAGERPPRRLTRSKPGESDARFAPDGSLLFTSARPGAKDEDNDEKPKPALWLLPERGGEARPLAAPSGGVASFAVAKGADVVVYSAGAYPGAKGDEEDAGREKAREEAGVGARLFEEYPIRFWDHFLGPREPRLYLTKLPEDENETESPKDLTPAPGRSLDLSSFDLSPDGRTVALCRWNDAEDPRERALDLVALDAETGEERILAAEDDAWYSSPAFSPDGKSIAVAREEKSTPERAGDQTLFLFDRETGKGRDVLPGFDLWPGAPVWSYDSKSVFFTADAAGHSPAFRLDMDTEHITRLSGEGAYSDLCPAPGGGTLYALRSTVSEPPRPVALDAEREEQEPRILESFEELDSLSLPARVERVAARTEDGTPVPSWLVLPPDASETDPAPLAVFIHGGPLSSWNSWHWRWNPHVFVNEGWAVLLPDPALSTGYGLEAIRRGWGRWGDVVYGDLMSAVDHAEGREDIDETRTVAMGGSFGGYMANWVAGHTDRFDAIVTHASLWDLEGFHGTSDLGVWDEYEFGDPYEDPERYREHSPHTHVKNIKTPMLVIHGELDHRVPISEALTLWTDLKRHGVEAKFLYSPDENHWVLKPNNSRLWYGTVMRFMDHHARGGKWERPGLL